ncbi:adenosylcobinamide-phosphate synthase CbiB [Nitrospira sp. MA-1]|nr:adenosylcobinamide-phosphate synthase CbiB [Nitrospira sp. MA-1]
MADDLTGFKFLAVCVVDLMIGDPRWLPHPVRLMGVIIQRYERLTLERISSTWAKKLAGMGLAVGLPLGAFFVTKGILVWAELVHEQFGMVIWVLLGSTTLAGRDLWGHAMRVHRELKTGSLVSARVEVGRLVGRDTVDLSEEEIVRATVESVSENTSDGIVAPLIYLALGGPACAMAYKAISTLDSMVGYRNDRYRDFGWASARADDLVNWVPARLTAVAMSIAAAIRLGTGISAWKICWRDARDHPSPNSGWPEAAMAGALGVQLGGGNVYGGVREARARLGDRITTCSMALIPVALQVMGMAYGLLFLGIMGWVMW